MSPGRVQPKIRIASLAPSTTSILAALGALGHLVGVSKWCKDVAPVSDLPQLGDCWSLDLDPIRKLSPTLILGSVPFQAGTVTRLLSLRTSFFASAPRSLADIYEDIRLLGALVDRTAASERLVRKMQSVFHRTRQRKAAIRRRPRVYAEAWPRPRISSPPWVAELIELAGGRMCVPAGQRVSDRQVARARPDVIVLAWAATGDRSQPRSALRNPNWQGVPAVQSKRVFVVRDELLNTPGPPLMRGARELARILRPASAR